MIMTQKKQPSDKHDENTIPTEKQPLTQSGIFKGYSTIINFNSKKLLRCAVTALVLTTLAAGCEAGVEEEEELEEESLVPRIERLVAT